MTRSTMRSRARSTTRPIALAPGRAALAGSALAALLLAGPALASLSGLVGAWGHDFAVTPFEMRELMVSVATDKATGRRFNLVRMPNGTVMAMVPLDAMRDGMRNVPDVKPADLMR